MSWLPFSPFSVALVTPFKADGRLRRRAVTALIQRMKASAVPAVLVSGSTGEQHSLTVQERIRLYRWAVEASGPSVAVYAGVAAIATNDAVRLAMGAKRAGAAGIMLGFSPYLRLSPLDALEYARRVCGATDLPVLVYNNPLRTAFDLIPELLYKMAALCPTIVAIKETSDPSRARPIKQTLGKSFQVFSGNDRTIVELWEAGFDGLTSVAGNLWPGTMLAVVKALESGDSASARAALAGIAPHLSTVIESSLPASLKFSLRHLGLPGGWCREPLGHLEKELEARIVRALAETEGRPSSL